MLKKLIFLFKPEGLENIQTPDNTLATFYLYFKNYLIGELKLDKGIWYFNYSEEYKKHRFIPAITDFPNIDKEYKSEDLWPFFISRIPSRNQPWVIEKINRHKVKDSNPVDLLKLFGKFTITNPYVLTTE